MKTKAISSIFVLFAIAVGMASMAPTAFADHPTVSIGAVEESGFSQDCAVPMGGDGCYTPYTATVDLGGDVTMTNTDPTGVHTFTSGTVDGFTPQPDGVFDSGVLMSGDAFDWTPTEAGTYPYYCMLHTWMIGEIIVQEAAAEGHGDDHGDDHGEMVHEEVAEDVELMVMISDSQVMGGTQIELEFNVLHLNYDLTATQNGEVVLQSAKRKVKLGGTNAGQPLIKGNVFLNDFKLLIEKLQTLSEKLTGEPNLKVRKVFL